MERAAHGATMGGLALAAMCLVVLCACQMQEEPLVRAAKDGDLAAVERLVSAGHDVNATEDGGATALTLAAFRGHDKIVQYLVAHGANVNKADAQGWTPLMVASELGYLKIVKILLEAGANVHARTTDGKTAMSLALARKRSEEVALLKRYGADK